MYFVETGMLKLLLNIFNRFVRTQNFTTSILEKKIFNTCEIKRENRKFHRHRYNFFVEIQQNLLI